MKMLFVIFLIVSLLFIPIPFTDGNGNKVKLPLSTSFIIKTIFSAIITLLIGLPCLGIYYLLVFSF